MKVIRKFKVPILLALAGFVFMLFPSSEGQAKTQLQFTLANITGTYYVIGAPIATYVNGHSNAIQLTPMQGAGVENMRRVNGGLAHLGMVSPVEMYNAWNGLAPFTSQMRNWRTIGTATALMLNHACTLAKYNIKTIEDVKGRIFCIGAAGSGATADMEEFLKHTGLYNDITIRKLPHSDVPTMVLDGKIHVFNRLGTVPSASVEEVGAQAKIALVDFAPLIDKSGFINKFPYYRKGVVKGGTYKGEDRDVTFFGTGGYIIAGKDVPDEVIYEFTRVAYSDECIKFVDVAYKGHDLNRKTPLVGNIGPVHPGAAKFWREIGLTIPDPVLK